MIHEIARLSGEVAELRRRLSQQHRRGRVHQVRRGENGREVRIKLADDVEGNPVLTPWLPWPGANGSLRVDTVPATGEHVFIDCPDGSWENAEVRPSNFHQAGEAPSEGDDDNVITYGDWRIDFTPEQIKITKGDLKVTLTEDMTKVEIGDDVVFDILGDKIRGRVDQSRLDITAQQLRMKREDNRFFVNADGVAMRSGGSWLYAPASGPPIANAPVQIGPPPEEVP